MRTEPLTSWKIRAPSSGGGEEGFVHPVEAADFAAQHGGPEAGDGGRDGQDGLGRYQVDGETARGYDGADEDGLRAQTVAVEFGERERDQRPGGTDGPGGQQGVESGEEEEGGRPGGDVEYAVIGFIAGAQGERVGEAG